MIFRHSLRFRIIIAFCLVGTVLGIIYAAFVIISLVHLENHLVENRLKIEVENFLAQYRENVDAPLPHSSYIEAYIDIANMPPAKQKQVKGLADGFYKTCSLQDGPGDYHIAVKTLPANDKSLYLFYDVGTLDVMEKRMLKVSIVLITGFVVIVGLGIWIGVLISRKVIAPVVQLADQVKKSGPENLPTELSKQFYDDEVGVLAHTIEQAMKRVESFVEREKQFTRYASHELRTPVTVIKGAVELLQQLPDYKDGSINRPLKRIERSVNDMESSIEALLWLAREEATIDRDETCIVLPVVQDIIQQYRHLLSEKPVEIELFTEAEPSLAAPAPVFKIAITNLIRNAIHNTSKGKIKIYIRDDRMVISDTGRGIEATNLGMVMQPFVRGKDSQGFGIGLAIVKRLCDRFDWHLEIESKVGFGTRAQLIFLPLR
ncbi:MAG: HAMP domain-containing histidine kinase [Nanoarchaeota archaeon]|nr:HAMP domain-containing histidine kinase [Nanoarchaeota archaeon]